MFMNQRAFGPTKTHLDAKVGDVTVEGPLLAPTQRLDAQEQVDHATLGVLHEEVPVRAPGRRVLGPSVAVAVAVAVNVGTTGRTVGVGLVVRPFRRRRRRRRYRHDVPVNEGRHPFPDRHAGLHDQSDAGVVVHFVNENDSVLTVGRRQQR
jgi:hypothetical protein